jgi:RNA 3'-terminal phosphate cyclase (ATP)
MIEIDASYGEGGGQVLRSALALSVLTKKPIHVFNIRAGRKNPGLQAQHLTAVKALAELSGAKVEGAQLHSQEIFFEPKELRHGKFFFNIGTAGSISLLFQSMLPALAFTEEETEVELIGGTDVHFSPGHSYIQEVFSPTLQKMGLNVKMNVERWGFYPEGGGKIVFSVKPVKKLDAIELVERGELKKLFGVSAASHLSNVAERQKAHAEKFLKEKGFEAEIELVHANAVGKGSLVFLCARHENSLAGFESLGALGKSSEQVAEDACKKLLEFEEKKECIEEHLADQIILYAALAEGKSVFTTTKISRHLLTNIWVIEKFLPSAKITVEGSEERARRVEVQGTGFGWD